MSGCEMEETGVVRLSKWAQVYIHMTHVYVYTCILPRAIMLWQTTGIDLIWPKYAPYPLACIYNIRIYIHTYNNIRRCKGTIYSVV